MILDEVSCFDKHQKHAGRKWLGHSICMTLDLCDGRSILFGGVGFDLIVDVFPQFEDLIKVTSGQGSPLETIPVATGGTRSLNQC